MSNKKQLFGNSENAVSMEDLDSDATAVVESTQEPIEEPSEPVVTEPVVEPKTETPTEEPVVEPTEPIVEPVAEEPKPTEEPVTEPLPTLDISVLNKDLETNFEDLDSLKTELAKAAKIGEYETKLQELDTLKEEMRLLKENNEILLEQAGDPSKHFSSPESYKLEQFKKAFPDKDPSIAQNIFTKDLKSVDDFDIVKWGLQIDNPGLKGGEEGIKQTVAEEFGIDPELEIGEWSVSAQNRLVIKANEYRSKFETMKQIETPSFLDVDQIREQRQQEAATSLQARQTAWNDKSKEIKSALSELSIPIGTPKEGGSQEYFKWDVGSAKEEVVSGVVEQMIASGTEVNEDTIEFAKNAARLALQDASLPEIMAKRDADLTAKLEAEHLKKTHNPEPLTDGTRPEGDADKEKKELSDWAISPQGGSFKRKPLI